MSLGSYPYFHLSFKATLFLTASPESKFCCIGFLVEYLPHCTLSFDPIFILNLYPILFFILFWKAWNTERFRFKKSILFPKNNTELDHTNFLYVFKRQ